jgi:polyhydroxybutyrate depolymerase
VPYDGGTVGSGSGAWVTIGAKASLEKWKTIDKCTGTAETSLTDCETYKQCAGGVEVTLCSVPGATHFFYSSATGFNTPDVVWNVFTRFPLP